MANEASKKNGRQREIKPGRQQLKKASTYKKWKVGFVNGK